MADSIHARIRVVALTTLLLDALDDEEAMHLANDRLRADLRGLQARAQAELMAASQGRRLRLAHKADGSVVAGD